MFLDFKGEPWSWEPVWCRRSFAKWIQFGFQQCEYCGKDMPSRGLQFCKELERRDWEKFNAKHAAMADEKVSSRACDAEYPGALGVCQLMKGHAGMHEIMNKVRGYRLRWGKDEQNKDGKSESDKSGSVAQD